MVESFLDHFRAGRRGDFWAVVVKYIHGDGPRRDQIGSNRRMGAWGKLFHYIQANIVVRYLVLVFR